MLKEFEKNTIAELANEGFNGREIAKLVFDENPTSTNLRDTSEFLQTRECDLLRGITEPDFDNIEDWNLDAVALKNDGFNNSEIAEKVLGSASKINTVARFFKTTLAHALLNEIDKDQGSDESDSAPAILKKLQHRKLKVLYWDIETSPCVSYHYQHWKVNIRQDQAIKQSHLLSISYAFNDEEPVGFRLNPEEVKDEDDLTLVCNMIEAIEQADIIVGYNSKNFDLKVLNTRALYYGLPPILPKKHIDLFEQVKKSFRFPSNALGNVSAYLQLEGKLVTDKGLWRRCMEHWDYETCEQALIDMLTYNQQDIVATRDLHKKIQGWSKQTANVGAMTNLVNDVKNSDHLRCSKCGSDDVAPVEINGLTYTNVRAYTMYRCKACGGVSRSSASGLVGCPVS